MTRPAGIHINETRTLLVHERIDAVRGGRRRVNRIERRAGKRHHRPENAGVHNRQKNVEHRNAVARAPVPSSTTSPPKEAAVPTNIACCNAWNAFVATAAS
jgi:hypothetical protein